MRLIGRWRASAIRRRLRHVRVTRVRADGGSEGRRFGGVLEMNLVL